MKRLYFLLAYTGMLLGCGPNQLEPDKAMLCTNCADWNQPQEPFRLYGNTWYVGTSGLSSILIETDGGLVLIDGGLSQSAALIDANIREIGFDPLNITAILVSHAHYDHVGGVAALQRLSGATVFSSGAGRTALVAGKLQDDDPQYLMNDASSNFPAVRNVMAIDDGEFVTIGGVDIKAVLTPGHSPGSVSWTWETCVLDTCNWVVYADSLAAVSAQGYRFSDNPAAAKMIESAAKIADLECDILLSPHPFFFAMQDKLQQRADGNPFVNNVACTFYAETALSWLERRLESE